MVALVEAAFRRAWLEVKFSGGETIRVNLGPEPVKVGDDKSCTVWARGAAAVALRYWVRDNRVVCHDVTAGTGEAVVANGDERRAGAVVVTVRTATGGSAPSPAPRPKPQAAREVLELPPPEPPTPPRPAATRPAVAPVPPPVRTAAPPPPPKPVPPPPSKPVAKAAFVCGECGSGFDKKVAVCPNCGAMS
jgi:hypothetical protein